MLLPEGFIENTAIVHLNTLPKSAHGIYLTVCLAVMISLVTMPFVYTDIGTKAYGIVRPAMERTSIKPAVSGIIDSVFFNEGQTIPAGAVLLRIKDMESNAKKRANRLESRQYEQFIHDLRLLTSHKEINDEVFSLLQSPLYREQVNRFFHRRAEHELLLKKANKELDLNRALFGQKIISSKEFFDIQNNQERIKAVFSAFINEQVIGWQQDLVKCQFELSQCRTQLQHINTESGPYEVKAPVAGTIQGINSYYPGGIIQANEVLCTISPDVELIGECLVNSGDIGLLKTGQHGYYQVDAFDYNFFGTLTGKIISIADDYTIVENNPFFKVRCSFDNTTLSLKNGFSTKLKKGLTFQARFIVARRNLWQLLWDKLDDWFNPAATGK